MDKRNKWIVTFIVGAFFVSATILSSGVMAQATQVDDETCLGCHDEMEKTLAFTPHNLSSQVTKAAVDISCSSCHEGGSVHADDPSVENITNPQNLLGFEAVETCASCHQAHNELDNYGYDAHNNQQLNCSSCHKVHSEKGNLLLDDKAQFCTPCHGETATKFIRRSNHPVKQGVLTCLSCHQFTKRQDNNYAYDLERTCQSCHPQHGGPYLYEHDAVNAYPVDGSGCIECHDPHGSENDRLLKQKGNELCGQCHIEHATTNHGNQWNLNWSKLACQTCHTDLHGSFTHENLLDPNLEVIFGGNCFNTGCHKQN